MRNEEREYNEIWEMIAELPSDSVLRPLVGLPSAVNRINAQREKAKRARRFKMVIIVGIFLVIATTCAIVWS